MAPPAFNLAGSGRLHAKSAGNGSIPSRSGSDRAPPSSPLERRPARPTAPPLSVLARVCTRTTLAPLACSTRMGRRPSRRGIKPRPSPSHIFCCCVTAHLEISPDATTIFRCNRFHVLLRSVRKQHEPLLLGLGW